VGRFPRQKRAIEFFKSVQHAKSRTSESHAITLTPASTI
jgi:hypothetical protein